MNFIGDKIVAPIRKKLISGGVWAISGKLISVGAVFGMSAVLARSMDPNEVGVFFVIFNIISAAAIFGGFGLKQAVIRFIGESLGTDQPDRAIDIGKKALLVSILGAAVTALLYLLLGDYLANVIFKSDVLASVTGIVSLWIFIIILQNLVPEIFRGFQDLRFASLFDGALPWSLLTFTLVTLFFLGEKIDLYYVLRVATITGFFCLILGCSILFVKLKYIPRSEKSNSLVGYKELLNVSSIQWITGLAFFVSTQADILIISAFLPDTDVALYGAAARLTNLLAIELVLVNLLVKPMIAQMYFQGKYEQLESLLRVTATLIGVVAFFVFALLFAWGQEILAFIFGDYYQNSFNVLRILCIGKGMHVWAGSCGLLLNMTGHHRQLMFITLATSIVTIICAIFLVPYYGIEGVACANAFGFGVVNFIMVMYSLKVIGIKTYMYRPDKLFL